METKHTFLFTMVLALIWTGFLFARVTGPDPASNGIFGDARACSRSGCHSSFQPIVGADASGSVSISGLPTSGWVPGQTYPLAVTIQRTGQSLFGFQLSAVVDDGTNLQAGTLSPGDQRVKVICGIGQFQGSCTTAGAVQYAEHINATNVTHTYNVDWTAPPSASAGTVRFNLAGNAANGDLTPSGDFIYTRIERVSPVAITDNSTRSYTVVDRGGISLLTDGTGPSPLSGYSRIQPDSGSTTPSGVAIFGGRTNGVLVSETGVPATPALTTGRIYAEIAGPVNTGFALVNPNDVAATVTFFYTDTSGNDLGAGSTIIQPNSQIVQFLNQKPLNTFSGSTFQGTFSFSSTVPVGVVALRTYTNEYSDFLMSTLPVIDTSVLPQTGTQVVPYYVDGGGSFTQILLVNPTDTAMTGTVVFDTSVTIGGETGTTFPYSVPARSSQKLATSGTPVVPSVGPVRVIPTDNGAAPTPLIVFSYKPLGVVVSAAGVPTISGTVFRMYAESSGTLGQAGSIQTGVAIANNDVTSDATVTFELTNLDGSTTGLPDPISMNLSDFGSAKFLSGPGQIFPSLPDPFKGVLRVSTTSPSGISIVVLRTRYNERTTSENFIFTTAPPVREDTSPAESEFLFPDLVNGAGYTTQFILFSGSAGQTPAGTLRFFKSDGTAYSLVLN